MIKQHLKLKNEKLEETEEKISSLRNENLLQEYVGTILGFQFGTSKCSISELETKQFQTLAWKKGIEKLQKNEIKRKQKLKLLKEHNGQLKNRLRSYKNKMTGLKGENLELEKIRKTTDDHMCKICFESVSSKGFY